MLSSTHWLKMKSRRQAGRGRPLQSRMTAWYDPSQLFVTGVQTVLSGIFAQLADYRLIQALGPVQGAREYLDRDELWIDYVADVGDGFNSTYSVARVLTATHTLPGEPELQRGHVLIMGGDEVYPTPTRAAYEERLVAPYAAAFPAREDDEGEGKKGPDLFAIPGNHDWYDGLASFMNLFCYGQHLGGWTTPQKRSYFALHLREGWWLLGVDIQLESDLDNGQIEYFLQLGIKEGDRVILCTAEPDWVYGNIFAGQKHLGLLESLLVEGGAQIVLQLAGDLHHYRRHVIAENGGKGDVHLVTAGGGGAFLHPTHTHDIETIQVGEPGKENTYTLEKEYPIRSESRRLGLKNLAFPLFNPWFGLVTAGAYAILSLVMPVPHLEGGLFSGLAGVVDVTLRAIASTPSSVIWIALVLAAFVVFTDTHKPFYKVVGGLAHGTAHMAAALVVALWLAGSIRVAESGIASLGQRAALTGVELAAGYVVGSLLMGIYLTISVCVFRRHGNEAFSSLKLESYRNCLRMRLDADGLSVWALGLCEVPGDKQWEWREEGGAPARWEPVAGAPKLVPEVIDKFHIPARKKRTGGRS